jgi:cytochrome b
MVVEDAMSSSNEIRVWDPLVRLFHWSLVVAFVIAYLTGDELEDVHVLAGYFIAGLVVFRLIWGVVGTRHARFSDFVFSPPTVIAYLKDILAFRAKRYIGHNPAGGAMVVALLISLSMATLSGMKLLAVEENEGPFAAIQIENISPVAIAMADEDEDEHDEGEEESVWEEVHEFFVNFTLLLVLLHLAGVALSSIAHGENLPRAMVTGTKRQD